jgi:hypothetical protein
VQLRSLVISPDRQKFSEKKRNSKKSGFLFKRQKLKKIFMTKSNIYNRGNRICSVFVPLFAHKKRFSRAKVEQKWNKFEFRFTSLIYNISMLFVFDRSVCTAWAAKDYTQNLFPYRSHFIRWNLTDHTVMLNTVIASQIWRKENLELYRNLK